MATRRKQPLKAPPRQPHTAKKRTGAAKKRAAPKKKALPRKKAARKKRTAPTENVPEPAQGFFPSAFRFAVSALLTYLLVVTALTFIQSISLVQDYRFWTTAPAYFFALGVAILPLLLWGFSDTLLYLYVFGHELTHVVFIYLCGGKVYGDIRVSIAGGHVVTDKTNWLISLSPYFVPFYTVLAASGFLAAGLLVDLGATFQLAGLLVQPLYLLYTLIGVTWAMHIYYTVSMLTRDQPDLRMNGTLLSLLVILLVNSLIVMALLTWASESISFRSYLLSWFANATDLINDALVRIARLIW